MSQEMMRAAVLHAPRDVRIEGVNVPRFGPNDVLVRIGAVGVCGSDVHYYVDGRIGKYVVEQPLILGHECAGTVVAVGEAVRSLQVGDRVALEPGIPCRKCDYCKQGRYNLCPEVVFMATPPIDGAFCEYFATPADFAFKLPSNMSLEEGALMEPLAVGLHSAKRGRVAPGDAVVILGAGPIGLMILQAARAYGASARIVVDIDSNRLQMASRLGATHVVNSNEQNPVAAIASVVPKGTDVVFEAAGTVPTSQMSTQLVRRGGRIVWTGLPGQSEVPISILEIVDKEVDIMGVFRYANVYPQAILLASSGQIDVRSMVTHALPLERTAEALDLMHTRAEGAIKVIVRPQAGSPSKC